MSGLNKLLSRAALAAITSAACACAWADRSDERDHRDLSSAWWQWALSIPASVSPVLDATGQQCMVGQRGSTWFLAGNFGGAASRSCSVPQGTKLFFPVANSVNFDTPGVCGQVGHLSVAELRGFSAAFIDSLTQVSVTLDGRPLRSVRRIRSEVFPLALPVDNLFTSPGCFVPAAVYPRSVDDGYYAEIDQLPPGVHTLQIMASNAGGFNLNVVYTLTIVPRDRR